MSVIMLYLLITMLAVLWLDITRYTIPNWLVAMVLVAYPVLVFQAHGAVDWQGGLMAFGIMFALGFAVFAMGWMGGGDIKLLAACALWVGIAHLMEFALVVSLLGGVFSLLVWGGRKTAPRLLKTIPRILQEGAPIPYGVAIAFGFLWMMWSGAIAG